MYDLILNSVVILCFHDATTCILITRDGSGALRGGKFFGPCDMFSEARRHAGHPCYEPLRYDSVLYLCFLHLYICVIMIFVY